MENSLYFLYEPIKERLPQLREDSMTHFLLGDYIVAMFTTEGYVHDYKRFMRVMDIGSMDDVAFSNKYFNRGLESFLRDCTHIHMGNNIAISSCDERCSIFIFRCKNTTHESIPKEQFSRYVEKKYISKEKSLHFLYGSIKEHLSRLDKRSTAHFLLGDYIVAMFTTDEYNSRKCLSKTCYVTDGIHKCIYAHGLKTFLERCPEEGTGELIIINAIYSGYSIFIYRYKESEIEQSFIVDEYH